MGQSLIVAAGQNLRTGMGFTAEFVKHREVLRRELDVKLVILLLSHAPAVIRRQMVERRIGFLAPGAQLYVPEALLDLRERSTRAPSEPTELITPTAQLLLIAVLLGERLEDANLTELAERLGVAVMSMSRALDELEALQIAKARNVGRQRRLNMLLQGQELWESIKNRLQSPVRKVRMVSGHLDDKSAPRASESALAQYTMLAAPRVDCRAIAAARWKQAAMHLKDPAATVLAEDRTELETWSYEPRTLAHDGVVDPISLYLSIRHHTDERVAQAAEQLLEPFGW